MEAVAMGVGMGIGNRNRDRGSSTCLAFIKHRTPKSTPRKHVRFSLFFFFFGLQLHLIGDLGSMGAGVGVSSCISET